MKKPVYILLSLLLVFAFLSCDDGTDDEQYNNNNIETNYHDTIPVESGLRGTKWVYSRYSYEFSEDGKTYSNDNIYYYVVSCIKVPDANIFGTTWYVNRMRFNGYVEDSISFHVNDNELKIGNSSSSSIYTKQ